MQSSLCRRELQTAVRKLGTGRIGRLAAANKSREELEMLKNVEGVNLDDLREITGHVELTRDKIYRMLHKCHDM